MWINRVITCLGMDRWYLVFDSDECFVYPHYEVCPIQEYIHVLEQKDIYAVKSLLLELYPEYDLFTAGGGGQDRFITEYRWFDRDGDEYIYDPVQNDISGGVHNRIFETNFANRTKVVLFKATQRRFLVSAHEIYPHWEYVMAQFGAILLHYKFLADDLTKIDNAVKSKTYANNSYLYRQYQRVFADTTKRKLFFEGSAKWEGTQSFGEFSYIKDLAELDKGSY